MASRVTFHPPSLPRRVLPGVETYSWDSRPEDTAVSDGSTPALPGHRYYDPGTSYVIAWASWEAQSAAQGLVYAADDSTAAPWNTRRKCMPSTQYWGYHVDRVSNPPVLQVGMPPAMLPQWYLDEGGNQQKRFAAWISDHTGTIWLLGNEPGAVPDLAGHGQDALTDREYVAFFHDYHQFISSLDPTAQFANAGLAMTTTPTWRADLTVESVAGIWDNVLALYYATHGIEIPLDIWNMHLYAGDGCQQTDLHRQKFMTAIMAFRGFRRHDRGGHYQGHPLILTEFNGSYAPTWQQFSQENFSAFLLDFIPYLELPRQPAPDKWFWFVSGGGTQWPSEEILRGGQATLVESPGGLPPGTGRPRGLLPVYPFRR